MLACKSLPKRALVWLLLGTIGTFATPATAAEMELAFAVSGVVEKILVKPGQSVAAGTALARLDASVWRACNRARQARVEATAARLAVAQTHYQNTKALYDALSVAATVLAEAEVDWKTAKADHAEAEARAEQCRWRLERSVLKAPVAGVVAKVPGYPGQVVSLRAVVTPVVVLKIK